MRTNIYYFLFQGALNLINFDDRSDPPIQNTEVPLTSTPLATPDHAAANSKPATLLVDVFHSPPEKEAPSSRRSSISSEVSESSFFSPGTPSRQYMPPSDIESEVDEPSYNLDGISKEEIFHHLQKAIAKNKRSKAKFMEVRHVRIELELTRLIGQFVPGQFIHWSICP
jgi:hypothetical protein